jgi:hypothetical protein
LKNSEDIYNEYLEYLKNNVPEIGNVYDYQDDPTKYSKTCAVLVPEAEKDDGAKRIITFELRLFVHEKNISSITRKMLGLASTANKAINSPTAPHNSRTSNVLYAEPIPTSPNMGVVFITIELSEYLTDCSY